MKFTCSRDSLLDSLNLIHKIVRKGLSEEIVEKKAGAFKAIRYVAFEKTATPGEIEVYASDGHDFVLSKLKISGVMDGLFILYFNILYDIIKALDGANVTFVSKQEGKTVLECAGIVYNLRSPVEKLIPRPNLPEGEPLYIPYSSLKKLIDHTSFAVLSDDTSLFSSCLLTCKKHKLEIICSNQSVIAYQDLKITNINNISFSVAIKGEFLVNISKVLEKDFYNELEQQLSLIENSGANVTLQVTDRQVVFTTDTNIISSTLLNWESKNFEWFYNSININSNLYIDKKTGIKKIIDYMTNTTNLYYYVKCISLMACDADHDPIIFNFSKDKVEITCASPYKGDSRITIKKPIGIPNFTVGFNPSYLLKCLKHVENKNLTLKFLGDNHNCMIKSSNNGETLIYLLAAVRVYR